MNYNSLPEMTPKERKIKQQYDNLRSRRDWTPSWNISEDTDIASFIERKKEEDGLMSAQSVPESKKGLFFEGAEEEILRRHEEERKLEEKRIERKREILRRQEEERIRMEELEEEIKRHEPHLKKYYESLTGLFFESPRAQEKFHRPSDRDDARFAEKTIENFRKGYSGGTTRKKRTNRKKRSTKRKY